MNILINFFILSIGFFLLIKGADYLVEGASSLAKRLSISELVIGLTIVSFGTSAPELVVNVISAVKGSNGLVFGNVIGSNLFNILLVLGVAGAISPVKVRENTVWREIPFALLGAGILFILVNDSIFNKGGDSSGTIVNQLSHGDGIVLLSFFSIFIAYVFAIARVGYEEHDDINPMSLLKASIITVAGLVGLMVGGEFVVRSAVDIAKYFGVTEKLIGLTIVAAGTSLPELATTAMAAYRKRSDIAIGNIIGSNIFNVFLILGVSATIHPSVYETALNEDLVVMIFASFLVFLFMFTGKGRKLNRPEAIIFLAMFAGYIGYIINRG